jgi:hypothetical protein
LLKTYTHCPQSKQRGCDNILPGHGYRNVTDAAAVKEKLAKQNQQF